MKRSYRVFALCIVALIMIVTGVRAEEDAAVKKELTAQYQKMLAAFKAKDVKGLLAPATMDLTMKLPSGRIFTRTQLEDMYKKQFVNTRSVVVGKNEIAKLEVKGDQAITTMKAKWVIIANQGGRYRTFDSTEEGRDTWVKTTSGWRLKTEEITKSKTLIDGKETPK
ncbi:MAG TPA: nuclear transport factor 2 family protein [Chthonomonadaceae bacterium]|nr:nuclear transport factor 2 family protein [Chthonomonadaceae bacterium]